MDKLHPPRYIQSSTTMRPFHRGRGNFKRNFDNRQENSRGIQRGRGRGKTRSNFQNFEKRGSFNNRGFNRNFKTELENHQDHRREEDYYEDDYRHERNHVEEGYYDDDYRNETRLNHDYDRVDYRSRCESDSLDHDRHSRGEFEYSEREYDRVNEEEHQREEEHYRGREYDQEYFDKQDEYYGHDRENHEKENYQGNYKDQHYDEKYRRTDNFDDKRRHDHFEDHRGHHDHSLQHNNLTSRESSLHHGRGSFSSGERHYNKNRFDGYASKWNKENNNFRGRHYKNGKRGYHHDQQNHWDRRKRFDTTAESTLPGKSSDNYEKNPPESCDWPTNESGIKMAIEYLKNKPELEKLNTSEETKEEIDQSNLPIIDPLSLGQEAVEDLISDLLNLILTNGGEIPIKNLEKAFVKSVNHRFQNENILKTFLEKYPKVFELDTEDSEGESAVKIEIVRAKTEVELCQAHSNHPKSCTNSECIALHICKFYILSSCEMIKCKFGHDLSDDHNIAIQQRFYLHRVSLPNLCLLLQHDANRCIVTIPIICRFYNGMKGCRSNEKIGNPQQQSQRCPYLHICQNFVESRCATWSSCRRNHDLLKENVHEILCKFGLDPRVLLDGSKRVLNLLRSSISTFNEKSPRAKIKSRYIPVQLRMNEEQSRLGLKRKVQVGGDDDISIKIQRVMETSLSQISSASNSQEQIFDDTIHGFESLAQNGNTNELGSRINDDRNKNVNITSLALDQISKNSSTTNVDDNGAPSWSIYESSQWKELPLPALKDIETKYQIYLASKCATVLLNGKYFKIDFSNLEGSYAGSSNVVKVQRNIKKEPNEANITEMDIEETEQANTIVSKVEKDDVSFGSVKDANFIKF